MKKCEKNKLKKEEIKEKEQNEVNFNEIKHSKNLKKNIPEYLLNSNQNIEENVKIQLSLKQLYELYELIQFLEDEVIFETEGLLFSLSCLLSYQFNSLYVSTSPSLPSFWDIHHPLDRLAENNLHLSNDNNLTTTSSTTTTTTTSRKLKSSEAIHIEHLLLSCMCVTILLNKIEEGREKYIASQQNNDDNLSSSHHNSSLIATNTLFPEDTLENCVSYVIHCIESLFMHCPNGINPISKKKVDHLESVKHEEDIKTNNNNNNNDDDEYIDEMKYYKKRRKNLSSKELNDSSNSLSQEKLNLIENIIYIFLSSLWKSLSIHSVAIPQRLCIPLIDLGICILKSSFIISNKSIYYTLLQNQNNQLDIILSRDETIPSLAIKFISGIFSTNKSHRGYIIQDILTYTSLCYNQSKFYPKSSLTTFITRKHLIINDISSSLIVSPPVILYLIILQNLMKVEVESSSTTTTTTTTSNDKDNNSDDKNYYLESTKKLLYETNMISNVFITELMKRCRNKETGLEYRTALNDLIGDLLLLYLKLDFPASSLLLTSFVRRSTIEISESLNHSGEEMKNEISYILFLIDVLGGFGSKLREIGLTGNLEVENFNKSSNEQQFISSYNLSTTELLKKSWNTFALNNNIIKNISNNLNLLNQDNDVLVTNTSLTTQKKGRTPKKKLTPSKSKKIINTEKEEIISLPIGDTLHIYNVLTNILLEVECEKLATTSNSIFKGCIGTIKHLNFDSEIELNENKSQNSKEIKERDNLFIETENDNNSISNLQQSTNIIRKLIEKESFSIPNLQDLSFICSNLSNDQFTRLFPEVNKLDLKHYCIVNYLLSQLQLNETGSLIDPSNPLYGSILINLNLWMMNCIKSNKLQIVKYISNILTKLHYLTCENSINTKTLLSNSNNLNDKNNNQNNNNNNNYIDISNNNDIISNIRHLNLQIIESMDKSTNKFNTKSNQLTNSNEWSNYCYQQIVIENRFLMSDFLSVQKSLLLLFSHHSPQVRARVIRSLSMFVKSDPSLFENKTIQDSVIERFNDMAISVREEAVKLVGCYLLKPNNNKQEITISRTFGDQYLNGILTRLKDKGVSVRKSVVTILRDMLLYQPYHPRYSEICVKLLERSMNPKEEDTLKDIIRITFQQVWFNPVPIDVIQSTGIWSVLSTPQHIKNQETSTRSISPLKNSKTNNDNHDNHDNNNNNELLVTPSKLRNTSIISVTTPISTASISTNNATTATFIQQHIDVTALQIVDVIYLSLTSGGNESWLTTMIREVIHGSNTEVEANLQAKKRQLTSKQHCERLIECLMELLMTYELYLRCDNEKQNKNKNIRDNGRTSQETIVSIFVSLASFFKAHPPFIERHIHRLLPYLKGENGLTMQQESILCFHLVQMISIALQVPSNSNSIQDDIIIYNNNNSSNSNNNNNNNNNNIWKNRADEIASDLIRIALTFPSISIQAAVECLSQLATHICHHNRHLISLATKCFDAIYSIAITIPFEESYAPGIIKNLSLSASDIAKLQRSIIVLGCICEQTNQCPYLNNENIRNNSNNSNNSNNNNKKKMIDIDDSISQMKFGINQEVNLISFNESAINGCCYVCVKFCLSLNHDAIQSRASQALCSIFVGKPNLILRANKDGILQWLLGSSNTLTPDAVISKTLQSLQHVMITEEKRLEFGAALDQMKVSGTSLGSRVQGKDVIADGTITGSVLQQHITTLTKLMTSSNSSSVRLSALELIGTLLNHGMVHPMDVLTMIISMLGDEEEIIRQAALKLLVLQDEKQSTFLDNRIIDGLENLFYIQKRTQKSTFPLLCDFNSNSSIGQTLYSTENIHKNLSSIEHDKKFTSILTPLYIACFKSNKKRRTDLIIGILRRCELQCQNISSIRLKIQLLITSKNKTTDNNITNNNKNDNNENINTTNNDDNLFDSSIIEILSKSLSSNIETDQLSINNRKGLNNSLISNDCNIKYLIEQAAERFELVSFLCTILSSLPFTWVDEPLNIIYWINRNTNITTSIFEKLYGSCLLQTGIISYFNDLQQQEQEEQAQQGDNNDNNNNNKTTFMNKHYNNHYFKLRKSQNQNQNNNLFSLPDDIDPSLPFLYELDQLLILDNKKCNEKKNETTNNLSIIDSVLFSVLSIECHSRIVLMRLKGFLKAMFSLSDERCLAFTPSFDKDNQDGKNNRISSQSNLSEFDKKHYQQIEIFKSLPSFLEVNFNNYLSNKHIFTFWETKKYQNNKDNKVENENENKDENKEINKNKIDINSYDNLTKENEETFLKSCIRSYNILCSLLQIDTNDFTFNHNIEKKTHHQHHHQQHQYQYQNKRDKSNKLNIGKIKKMNDKVVNCSPNIRSRPVSERKRKVNSRYGDYDAGLEDEMFGELDHKLNNEEDVDAYDSDYEN